jgi:hypothetical protein
MATVLVGCKLPHGIVLKDSSGEEFKLNGVNTSLVAGGFGITNVEESKWAELSAIYEEFAPFKSGAIFTNGKAKIADLKSIAAELANVPTGFEGVDPNAPAANLKPEADLDKQLEAAERAPRPTKAPSSAADKAAANELAGA